MTSEQNLGSSWGRGRFVVLRRHGVKRDPRPSCAVEVTLESGEWLCAGDRVAKSGVSLRPSRWWAWDYTSGDACLGQPGGSNTSNGLHAEIPAQLPRLDKVFHRQFGSR